MWMANAALSRARVRDLARLGRSRALIGRQSRPTRTCAARRLAGPDASLSIAAVQPASPRATSPRPEAYERAASSI
jgi:hypothetical protein